MLLHTIELEGDYMTFVGETGTTEEGLKQSYRNLSIKEMISSVPDNNVVLVHQSGNTSSYDYTKVEDPSTPGIAFVSLDTFRTYITDNTVAGGGGGFIPVNGNGTTVNGSAIDVGGDMTSNIILDNKNNYNFRIQNASNDSHYWFNDDSMHIQYEAFGGNNFSSFSLDYNDCVIDLADYTNNTYSYNKFEATTSYGRNQISVQNSVGTMKIDMDTRNGITFTDEIGVGVHMPALKSGSTQATALAATNELWVTTSHATLPDGVVMRGL